jgi:HEAT repeat protein
MHFRQVPRGVIVFFLAVLPFSMTAQDLSVEDAYLQQSAEIQVIRELSADTSREQKEMALAYIGEMIDRGTANDDVCEILAELTLDGVQNQVRLGGRLINNFPDIRIRAIDYLAQMGTPEAKKRLIDILNLSLQASNVVEDPSVITAAIKGLSKIGGDNGDTLQFVNAAFLRYNTLRPDNALAQAVILAIDTFVEKGIVGDARTNMAVLMAIQANYEYIRLVRDNASVVIAKLRGIGI